MNLPYHGMEGSRTNIDKNNVIHPDPSRDMPLDSWDLTKYAWLIP
jgi:hypothetical protein